VTSLKTLIVVPTHQEVDNVDELLERIAEHAPEAHVLFVDDASTDGTRERVAEHAEKRPGVIHALHRPAKMGLGTAYIAGFRWALERDYEAIIQMDADLSHDPASLPGMRAGLAEADVVVGSRYVPGGGTRNWGLGRRLISRGGGAYARLILGIAVQDPTGGFNGWRREVLETLDLDAVKSEGYSFQIEMKSRALRRGFRLQEVPIVFEDRRAGQSKMSRRIVAEALVRVWSLRRELR
jgi:dolichol-phosphate mannosyltransferase